MEERVNLTELWTRAGRESNRAPSKFKTLSLVKRAIAAGAEWTVEGRGARAVTYSTRAIATLYIDYLNGGSAAKGHRSESKAHKAASTDSGRTYTEKQLNEAILRAYKVGYEEGFRAGEQAAQRDMGRDSNGPGVQSRFRDAKRRYAHKYHPDHSGGDASRMTFINGIFDELEKVLFPAA